VRLVTKMIEGKLSEITGRYSGEAKERIQLDAKKPPQACDRERDGQTGEKAQLRQDELWQEHHRHHRQLPEAVEARELPFAVNYKGPKQLPFCFNPRYLIDPLAALSEDDVFIEMIDNSARVPPPEKKRSTAHSGTWVMTMR